MHGAKRKRLVIPLAAFVVATSLLAIQGEVAAVSAAARVTEFRLPGLPSYPGAIAAGPGGDMWFAALYVHGGLRPGEGEPVREVDRISAAGTISKVAGPFDISAASAVTAGPDGNFWFADEGRVGEIAASGAVTEFPLETRFPTTHTHPLAIASGPDGNLWFAATHTVDSEVGPPERVEVVDRMTPAGQVSEFPLAGKELELTAITAGPDGNVWFTERGANKIGRVTPSGQIAEFAISTEGASPSGIAAGPDGNVWFTEQGSNPAAIGRITPSGQVTEFPLEGEDAYPGQIVPGPDGRLWFSYGVGAIGTVSPTGAITRIELPHRTQVHAVAVGPESDVWYTAEGDGPCLGGGGSCQERIPKEPGVVGRIEPGPTAAQFLDPRAFARHRWTKIELGCGGGHVGDFCRGVLRLRVRVGRHSSSPGSGASPRTFLVAGRHFALATDERRAVGVRLMPPALSLLARHSRLTVSAIVTLGDGESASRRLVLRRLTAHRRHAADDHR
jgi:virginiamycin B lyase